MTVAFALDDATGIPDDSVEGSNGKVSILAWTTTPWTLPSNLALAVGPDLDYAVMRDADGNHFITGRVDDVINVSGHRIGTAEVESALVAHPSVAQAAVVGKPHDIKGQGICAFCMLRNGYEESDDLIKDLRMQVRSEVGAFCSPDMIVVTPSLPMTRSGKIMRRILRKIVCGETDTLGDTSTLAEPAIVDTLIEKVESL